MSIHIIKNLQITNQGPEAFFKQDYQRVFLNQGSIDGACGPYSILMAFLTLGLIDRNEVTSFAYDSRTKLGKFMNNLNNNYKSLFLDGTDIIELKKIILHSFGSVIRFESENGKNKQAIKFILEHLHHHHPVIIGINAPDCAHWMLAVGYEESANDLKRRLLVLDPSGNEPIVSSWNSIINLDVDCKGRYPYYWWTYEDYIQFDQALAIWNK